MSQEPDSTALEADVEQLRADALAATSRGSRFVGLFGTASRDPDSDAQDVTRLTAVLASPQTVSLLDADVSGSYDALTPDLPAAFWYERALHDLFGVVPRGHPRLDPLVLPQPPRNLSAHKTARHTALPRPGARTWPSRIVPDERAVPRHVGGPGMFTIPHGPVRSGALESIEYLVETPGEEIPHVQVRVFAKHRGIEVAFQGRPAQDAVLLAERVEGICGVAHALAYCQAVEAVLGISVSPAAARLRVLHAELERIVNHLDVAARLADAAGLAVAVARFGVHKERIMRIRGRLCGSRFGRGAVVVGGAGPVRWLDPDELGSELADLARAIAADARALMATSSFLDRVRGTGQLEHDIAYRLGSLGPVARASGYDDDARRSRPYAAYGALDVAPLDVRPTCDAQARLEVRWEEVAQAFTLIEQVLDGAAAGQREDDRLGRLPAVTGRGVGWAESPQGEVVYVVELDRGGIVRCWPRSASFHNLMLFHEVFNGDVLTDFAFIEASFGLSVAGAVL